MSIKVFVGTLTPQTTSAMLRAYFDKHGMIEAIEFKEGDSGGRFAVLTFEDEAGKKAIAEGKVKRIRIGNKIVNVGPANEIAVAAPKAQAPQTQQELVPVSAMVQPPVNPGDLYTITGFLGNAVIALNSSGKTLEKNGIDSLGLSDRVTGARTGNKFSSGPQLVEYALEIRDGLQNSSPDPDRNPYNFVEWEGREPWPAEEAENARHDQEYRGRVSGVLDVTLTARTPVFVPAGKIGGKSEQFFESVNKDSFKRYAIPGASIKGPVRALFEILTNSRAGVTSSDLEEVPLYRRRAAFLFSVTVPPMNGKDGQVEWCPFEFLDGANRIVPTPHRDPQLPIPPAGNATSIPGIVVQDWRANLLHVDSAHYEHGQKCKIGCVPSGVLVALPWDGYAAWRSMFHGHDGEAHRHLRETVKNAMNNPRKPYKASALAGRDLDKWNSAWLSRFSTELAVGDLLFGITDSETAAQVNHGASLICFGKNVNFLWPAPQSPKDAMGFFAARPEKDARLSGSDAAEATFGFAGDHSSANGTHPFRSRVRFSQFWAPNGAAPMPLVTLMPLTSPPGTKAKCRPLYLRDRSNGRPRVGTTWTTDGVQLRGRKIYWHQTPPAGQQVAKIHDYVRMLQDGGPTIKGEQLETLAKVRPLPAGTHFTGQVHFTNLTRAELGALIASIDPSLLWEPSRKPGEQHFGIKIGKGKPRGLGSMVADVRLRFLNSATTAASLRAFPGGDSVTGSAYSALDAPVLVECLGVIPSLVEAYKRRAAPQVWGNLGFARDLEHLLRIPDAASLRIYPPRFNMYGWMPEFGAPQGEAGNNPAKWPLPMNLARNIKP